MDSLQLPFALRAKFNDDLDNLLKYKKAVTIYDAQQVLYQLKEDASETDARM